MNISIYKMSTVKDYRFQYVTPNIWLGLSNKGVGCLLDEIWYKHTVSGIELDSDSCKKNSDLLCAVTKRISFQSRLS